VARGARVCYTRAPVPLDDRQREFWKGHGYLWLEGLFSPAEVADVARWTEEITAWPDVPGKWMRYYEPTMGGGKLLARVENFLPFHPGLDALFRNDRLPALLGELLGEPVVVFKDKINLKGADGAGFAPHQDAPAYVDFGIDFHLTVMVPVDPFTTENGCLEIARAAPQTAFLAQNADGTLRPDVVERLQFAPLLARPGDAIVFDSYVPHLSGPNRSGGPRRSYYVTYNRLRDGDRRADYARLGAQFNLGNPFE
jgi:2-aminoethylphosphonate dioxygenase